MPAHRFTAFVVSVGLWGAFMLSASAQAPGMLNYQGRVTASGTNFNGAGQFRFALVNGAGTTTYWSNGVSAVTCSVTRGLFAVLLGDTNVPGMAASIPAAVFTNADVRLRVWFSPTGSAFQQLSPDSRVAAAGYALMAATVPDGAITSAKLAPGSVQSYHLAAGPAANYAQMTASLSAADALPFDALQTVSTNGGTLRFTCRVGGATLGIVEGFVGTEELNSNYVYRVAILSGNPELNVDSYVGQSAVLAFQRHGRATFFDGVVSGCGLAGFDGTTARYVLEIVPQFALVRHRTDYRIYQEQALPELLSQVLLHAGVSNFDATGVTGDYTKRDYVVQYNETDLDFANRLMESEGVFYFFRHADGPETLVLGDHASVFETFAEYVYHGENAPPPSPTEEYVRTFSRTAGLFTGRATVNDYDFTKPTLSLMASAADPAGSGEDYRYGLPITVNPANATRIAGLRLKRFQMEQHTMRGGSNGGDVKAGGRFHLADASSGVFADDYVVTGVRHAGLRVTDGTNTTFYYGNQFTAIPAAQVFVPACHTPLPRTSGPTTAVVVGPAGETVYVDDHGRIKVQFHWDRQGVKDEHSSAWIRVAQPYAGVGYGTMFIPKVGHEVVVDFLEGNPDRPIVVGSVYNGHNVPYYSLPDSRYVSSILTATAAGKKSHEIKLDDTVGKECMMINSAKDLYLASSNRMEIACPGEFAVKTPNATLSGSLTVSGNVTASCDVVVSGNMTVSGDSTFGSVAPTSTSSSVQAQVGELTRKTAPIAFLVASLSGTTLTTLSAYNCSAARVVQGVYSITFTTPPSNAYYAPVITPVTLTPTPLFANVGSRTRTNFVFGIADINGTGVDKSFSVVVFGGF